MVIRSLPKPRERRMATKAVISLGVREVSLAKNSVKTRADRIDTGTNSMAGFKALGVGGGFFPPKKKSLKNWVPREAKINTIKKLVI
jgi:hypothetical protein